VYPARLNSGLPPSLSASPASQPAGYSLLGPASKLKHTALYDARMAQGVTERSATAMVEIVLPSSRDGEPCSCVDGTAQQALLIPFASAAC